MIYNYEYMSKKNVIREKTYQFSLNVIKIYKFLIQEKKEYVLSRQFLRSGTSIGANVEEALGAQSKKDFISKISIVYKEARETRYWIKLLKDSDYLSNNSSVFLFNAINEICKILGRILITSKSNNINNYERST